jgi:hypothetical protein
MDEKIIKQYRDKWYQIGTNTAPSDRSAAEAALKAIYVAAGEKPPEKLYWEASPTAGIKKVVELKKESGVGGEKSDQDLAYETFNECIYGQQDSGWLAFYDYLINEDKDELVKEKMSGQIELAKYCGWVWTYDTCAVLTEKPVFMCLDDNHRLHHENRKAIEYSDGTGVYVWHGTMIPDWYIEKKDEMTPQKILEEANLEHRRCMMEIYGPDRFLENVGFRTLHEDSTGVLVEYDGFNDDDGKPARFVRVVCPSTGRKYALRVDPSIRTAKAAVASTFQIPETDYNPTVES